MRGAGKRKSSFYNDCIFRHVERMDPFQVREEITTTNENKFPGSGTSPE